MRQALRIMAAVLLALAAVGTGWVVLYRVVPPPLTALMVIRTFDGAGINRDWVPLDAIAPALVTAVIAAEDTKFCTHNGFDWAAIGDALDGNEDGGPMRGGSTISQQTAKNAFLWPDRTWVRKGMEAGFTALMEALWPKRRVMEVYLNIIEWGDGLYGAEAAARAWFHKPASALTRREAALMAVVLPNPRRWSPAAPTPFIARRAAVIETRMGVVRRDGLDGCVTGSRGG
ncbi:monofunctional biosynthetic peptidoglycan transglycosylase [Azospirillum fermentarium]|uniref:monofunctional biosynthetic peptidoglycan transglycosylase n=1 Tax=Azospirillum fermentarium TaxID=1233114 RepID=UPI002226A8FD|nr:monofunctional biosynthetic peptidoglycan transglycosylase [Azospirillum fermentarium]MCW2244874.1 monofunctional biosynthetic peptidoglycan transglycosylase [Azospirillum fermentarium]